MKLQPSWGLLYHPASKWIVTHSTAHGAKVL